MFTNENSQKCVWYYKGKKMENHDLKSFNFMAELHNVIHDGSSELGDIDDTVEGIKLFINMQGTQEIEF